MDLDQMKSIRDFTIMYNRIVETCFKSCVFTFNYRELANDEIECVENCTNKQVNLNHRIGSGFADMQAKKLQDFYQQVEQQQQQQQQQPPQQKQ